MQFIESTPSMQRRCHAFDPLISCITYHIIHPPLLSPPNLPSTPCFALPPHSRNLKPEPLHATPIPLHRALARLLRVRALAEEHAFVALGFFVFADAAGLCRFPSVSALRQMGYRRGRGGGGGRTFGLAGASAEGLRGVDGLEAVGDVLAEEGAKVVDMVGGG